MSPSGKSGFSQGKMIEEDFEVGKTAPRTRRRPGVQGKFICHFFQPSTGKYFLRNALDPLSSPPDKLDAACLR